MKRLPLTAKEYDIPSRGVTGRSRHSSFFILHSSFFILLLVSPAWAQTPPTPPASPPTPPADALPKLERNIAGPFHPFNINGKNKGKFHCVVTTHGLNPMVMIFVRGAEPEKPVVDLLKKLDSAVNRYDKHFLGSCAVFLNDDILTDEQRASADTTLEDALKDDDRREELSKKLFEALDTKENLRRITLCLYGPAGPKGYEIGKDAEVTILLYRRFKIVDQITFTRGKMTDNDVDAVMRVVVDKLLPK